MGREISFYMATQGKVNPIKFNKEVANIEGIRFKKVENSFSSWYCNDNSREMWHYWIEGKSTRAVPILFHKRKLEIEIPFLPNLSTIELMGKIEETILKMINPIFENAPDVSYQEELDRYLPKDIVELLHSDNSMEEHYFKGVNGRVIYFGERLTRELKEKSFEEQKKEVEQIILRINYDYPNYDYNPNVFNYSNDQLSVQVLNNSMNCLLKKSDYIMIADSELIQPIFISQSNLNQILPKEWTLLDEYTVVVDILSQGSWKNFVESAKAHNLYDELHHHYYTHNVMKNDVKEEWEDDVENINDVYLNWW